MRALEIAEEAEREQYLTRRKAEFEALWQMIGFLASVIAGKPQMPRL